MMIWNILVFSAVVIAVAVSFFFGLGMGYGIRDLQRNPKRDAPKCELCGNNHAVQFRVVIRKDTESTLWLCQDCLEEEVEFEYESD